MEWIEEEYRDFMMEIYGNVPDWGLWKTKDGDWMDIKDMKESHIRNTINYLKKAKHLGNVCRFKIYELELELRLREIEKKLQTIKTN